MNLNRPPIGKPYCWEPCLGCGMTMYLTEEEPNEKTGNVAYSGRCANCEARVFRVYGADSVITSRERAPEGPTPLATFLAGLTVLGLAALIVVLFTLLITP